ncbi:MULTISPECIES: nuclear transport factor 2 family protein [Streptomyces]|uniref:nuclear transport factor 2 family protein n=1 Tax=Streptomyces TaxID=1883 RepID=UPI00201CF6C4|nr:nuclear transport factor 2 family protein [Streptomyces panaciradicis]MCL6672744.1 nuclear transport factor 2 family protein [Streptomyces panaciradicis]
MTSNHLAAPGAAAGLAEAAVVGDLLGRYLIGLDDGELDDAWARSLFTEDAVVTFPMSAHTGRAGLAAWHRASLAAFARTQHLGSPPVVDLDGERAVFRAQVLTTHVHRPGGQGPGGQGPGGQGPALFRAGTLARGRARRTPAGWRMSELSFRVLFTEGEPPRRT